VNATRLGAALASFGYAEHAKAAALHFSAPDRMATLGVPPVRIDVLSSITGVSFAAAWRGRKTVDVGGLRVAFLGEREFRRAKRASGRPQDLADIALLDQLKG
jgi:hypothetical protein